MHPLVLIVLVLFVAMAWVLGILLALIRLADSQAEHRDTSDGAAAGNADKKVLNEPIDPALAGLRNY